MIIPCHENKAIELALASLKSDKAFVYPTDTLYGFGANASSEKALNGIYELKQRPKSMPMSILVSGKEMLEKYAKISLLSERLIDHFLPGALTLVLPAKNRDFPKSLFSLEGYLGFRIPNHTFCLELAKEFDAPFVTTSVNISGQSSLNNMKEINLQFKDYIDLFISDKNLEIKKENQGSTIVLLDEDSKYEILREGVIPKHEIDAILK